MSELEELLRHHGVKGMKWGVSRNRSKLKKDISVGVNKGSKKSSTLLDKASGLYVPYPVAAALYTIDGIANVRVKRKIVKALGSRLRDFNKKDLNAAAAIVRRYSNVSVASDGKVVDLAKGATP